MLLKESHPDKGGSEEVTTDLTKLRDSLVREPLRLQVLSGLVCHGSVTRASGAMFDSLKAFEPHARAQVELKDGWPYLQVPGMCEMDVKALEVEVEFDQKELLKDGGSWTFAFGLKNGSTVHYRGDAAQHACGACL